MSAFDYRNFDDRRETSQTAKAARLAKFKARPPADDPEVIARAKARAEIAQARQDRVRERASARIAAELRAAEEKRLREEAELAALLAREAAELTAAQERRTAELTAGKAGRYARYAARKAKAKR